MLYIRKISDGYTVHGLTSGIVEYDYGSEERDRLILRSSFIQLINVCNLAKKRQESLGKSIPVELQEEINNFVKEQLNYYLTKQEFPWSVKKKAEDLCKRLTNYQWV